MKFTAAPPVLRALWCAAAALLIGAGGPHGLRAQDQGGSSGGTSFAERLEQAARAATNPLRALAEPANRAGSTSDPRGDDALRNLPSTPPPPARYDNDRTPGGQQRRHALRDQAHAAEQQAPAAREKKQAPAKPAGEKLETFVLKANIILGDGRSVRGRVTFRAPEKLVVRHKRDDIEYRKTVRVRDLRSIEITQWKGEPVRKNSKGEWIYRFNPRLSTVTLANDLVLQENARLLPYFENFTVRNSNGEVRLFSYWIDLLQKDGSWFTGITGPSNGLRRSGHKDVVQRIEFGETHDDQ